VRYRPIILFNILTEMGEISKSIEAYVAAELKIKGIKNMYMQEKADFKERLNTCKQFILEQMCSRDITCMEIKSKEDGQVSYIRIKHSPVGTRTFSHEDVMNILRQLSFEDTCESLIESVRDKTNTTETKPNIEISSSKERGVDIYPLPQDLKDICLEIINCKQAIREISSNEKAEMLPYEHIKQTNYDKIVDYLKNKDVHMVQKLSIPEGDKTWTYFLRCVQTIRSKPVKFKQLMELTTPHITHLYYEDIRDKKRMNIFSKTLENTFDDFNKSSITKSYSLILQKGPQKQK
jgi:hypothetical protein